MPMKLANCEVKLLTITKLRPSKPNPLTNPRSITIKFCRSLARFRADEPEGGTPAAKAKELASHLGRV